MLPPSSAAGKMRLARGPVVVHLVQHHPVGLLPMQRDVELSASGLHGHGLAGIGFGQLEELLEPVWLNLELGDDHEQLRWTR